MIFVSKGPQGVISTDGFIASTLVKSPTEWDISITESLKDKLNPKDIKPKILRTLERGASYRDAFRSRCLVEGCVLILVAIIGLLREKKFEKIQNSIEPDATPNGSPGGS